MFSNDKNVETIGQLVETIKHYIGLQKEYLKLDVVDKVVRLLTAFTITLVLLGLLTIVLIYLSFAAAFALGNWLGMVWGFCIVAAFTFSSCSYSLPTGTNGSRNLLSDFLPAYS